jgi:four helix bundle protein
LEGISRAQGEIRETIHHLKISFAKQYLDQEKLNNFLKEYDVCGRMLTNLGKSLRANT